MHGMNIKIQGRMFTFCTIDNFPIPDPSKFSDFILSKVLMEIGIRSVMDGAIRETSLFKLDFSL
jgi:hypothetical protein